MLSKKFRLNSKEIPSLARKGKRFSGELFDVKVWYDDRLELPLFTIAVSTKVDKKATVRNTIKRKFRAALYQLIKDNKLRKAKYLIVVKTNKLEELKSQEVEEKILDVLTKK